MPRPPRRLTTPKSHQPGPETLLTLIRGQPGITLRRLAGLLWMDLPWVGGQREPSATGTIYLWPDGEHQRRMTAAAWLFEQMEQLVQQGLLCRGPTDPSEVDALAALSYHPGGVAEIIMRLRPNLWEGTCAHRAKTKVPGEDRRLSNLRRAHDRASTAARGKEERHPGVLLSRARAPGARPDQGRDRLGRTACAAPRAASCPFGTQREGHGGGEHHPPGHPATKESEQVAAGPGPAKEMR